MQSNRSLVSLLLLLLSSITTTVAIDHGELSEIGGRLFRYHQIARGAWVGIPHEEWNSTLHKRNDDRLNLTGYGFPDVQSPDLEPRDLSSAAHAVYTVVAGLDYDIPMATMVNGWNALVQAASAAAGGPQNLYNFIQNSPFTLQFLNSYFSTIGAIQTSNGLTKLQGNPAGSSTSGSVKDAVNGAIQGAYSANPGARTIHAEVTDPQGQKWSFSTTVDKDGKVDFKGNS